MRFVEDGGKTFREGVKGGSTLFRKRGQAKDIRREGEKERGKKGVILDEISQ